MLRRVLFIVVAVLSTGNSEAREVPIHLKSDQTALVLSNPSSMTVNYNITCYKADGSGTVLALTNQNLAVNSRVSHSVTIADSGTCASGATPASSGSDINGKAYYMCTGSNTYANANNACGTGNSFCFPETSYGVSGCSGTGFWLKNDGSAQYAPNSCSAFGSFTAGKQAVFDAPSAIGRARKSASVSACSLFYNVDEQTTSSTFGSACCASPVSGSLCKITINTTNVNAHLASDSFMGGAPF